MTFYTLFLYVLNLNQNLSFSCILQIPLFSTSWMPDFHISDAYPAHKRKDIQITLQNVSQVYFLSKLSSVHAASFVLLLIKIHFFSFEHLGKLEHLLPYQDKIERHLCSQQHLIITEGTSTVWQEWNWCFNTSFLTKMKKQGMEEIQEFSSEGWGTPFTFALTRWHLTVQHIRKGSRVVMTTSNCWCKE